MRKLIVLSLVLAISVVVVAPNLESRQVAAASVSIRENQSCTKKFRTSGKKLMCLPKARGTGLTWQRYPKQKTRCVRLGVKVATPALECVRRTFSGSVRNAANYWLPPAGPFVYRTVYGDEWQPKIGQECSTHQLTLEQGIFQGSLRGLFATCLPTADGSRWIWQNGFPKLNSKCAFIGHAHGKLVCARAGNGGRWKKAPKGSVSADAMIREVKGFFARTRSRAHRSWVDQLDLFMFSSYAMQIGALKELRERAALAGVKVNVDALYIEKGFSISHNGITTCFRDPAGWDDLWNWWGSVRSVQEIPCSIDESIGRSRVVAALTELETKLRLTNDVQTHSANLMKLRRSVSAAYSFDSSSISGMLSFAVNWKYTVDGSSQVTSSVYKVFGQYNSVPATCYASNWDGTVARLTEVSCA